MHATDTRSHSLIALCLLLASTSAGASMFSCRDATGALLHQSSTDGCVAEICEIKAGGVPVCEETAQERVKREAKEKHDRDCKEKRRQGMLRDFDFLDKYPSRAVIDEKRDKQLAANSRDIRAAKQRRAETSEKLAKLNAEAQYYGPKHPMPDELKTDIEFYSRLLVQQEAKISRAEDTTAKINSDYDELIKLHDQLLKHEFLPVPCYEE